MPSPNFGPRRQGARPDLIVLHYTAMASAEAALARLTDPEAEVSCHYLIDRRGRLFRLVEEKMRAWHAGAGQWGAATDINSRSIGIELDNGGRAPFPAPQMAALEALLGDLMARRVIPPQRVVGHSDVAPLRKSDPGPRFDWRRLALGGMAVWPGPGRARFDEAGFRAATTLFGYAPGWPTEAVLAALRLRFRPWAAGPADDRDMGIALDLAARFPIDRRRADP
ncbi:N-acetylmuramoyl-L-alanine amidase [Rhodovulum iodosum]|nr:N-acetylmuramoyl-L-alanine amidase [Rhodovulum robiginosum]